jgi:peroxiredoxin
MFAYFSRVHRSVFAIAVLLLTVSCSPDKPASLEIGDSAPGFALQDLKGKTVQLADFKGSPVVIRFFLTDCKFCRADTPILNDYFIRYAEKGLGMVYVEALGIERARLDNFVDEFEIAFPVLQDKGGKVAASYKVRALPQTIILDPDHRIIAAILGGISEPELNTILSPYLD